MILLEQFVQNISKNLAQAGVENSLREAQLIVTKAADWDLGQVILRQKEPLPPEFPLDIVHNWASRRALREPMAYILGEREFFGRNFSIGPGALIPRPDSETLVEWVLEDHDQFAFQHGLDLCCGPGTLGLTLFNELACPFDLVDISAEALQYAQANLQRLAQHASLKIHQLDLLKDHLEHLPKVDLMVCNPPYIPTSDLAELMPEVRNYEPSLALDGGDSGLEFFESLLPRLSSLARPNCRLYVELGCGQQKILDAKSLPQGWTREAWRQDLAGISRVACFTFLDKYHG